MPRKGLQVLMVGTNDADAQLLSQMLRATPTPPHRLDRVHDVGAAVHAMHDDPPDLVFLDTDAPRARGEALDSLVTDGDVPTVLVTDDDAAVGRAPLRLHKRGYTLAQLIHVLKRALRGRWRASSPVWSCASCGSLNVDPAVVHERGAPFCRDCLAHARDIDERFDDLGGGD